MKQTGLDDRAFGVLLEKLQRLRPDDNCGPEPEDPHAVAAALVDHAHALLPRRARAKGSPYRPGSLSAQLGEMIRLADSMVPRRAR